MRWQSFRSASSFHLILYISLHTVYDCTCFYDITPGPHNITNYPSPSFADPPWLRLLRHLPKAACFTLSRASLPGNQRQSSNRRTPSLAVPLRQRGSQPLMRVLSANAARCQLPNIRDVIFRAPTNPSLSVDVTANNLVANVSPAVLLSAASTTSIANA